MADDPDSGDASSDEDQLMYQNPGPEPEPAICRPARVLVVGAGPSLATNWAATDVFPLALCNGPGGAGGLVGRDARSDSAVPWTHVTCAGWLEARTRAEKLAGRRRGEAAPDRNLGPARAQAVGGTNQPAPASTKATARTWTVREPEAERSRIYPGMHSSDRI